MTKKPNQRLRKWKFIGFPKPQPKLPDGTEPKPEEWNKALTALLSGDTKPIGQLLLSGFLVPLEVALILGTMLAPAPSYRDTVLVARVRKRWTTSQVRARFIEMAAIREEIGQALKQVGKLEAAIKEVQAKRQKRKQPASRAYLMKCWKLEIGPKQWKSLQLGLLIAMSTMKPNPL
jgi:hypothetical protein